MPLLLRCDELQKGMRLAEAFLWHGRMMLPGGKVLTEADVVILRQKYPAISLKIGDPILDSVAEFEDDSREREVAQEATARIAACMREVHERFVPHTAVAGLNFNAVKGAAAEVIEYIQSHPVSAALLPHGVDTEPYLVEHAGNVFYLCIVLGSAVRDYVVRERLRQTAASDLSGSVSMNLLPLGLGAMFMDVGMYPLQHLLKKAGPLTAEERAAIHEHPTAGAEMLPEVMPPGVRMIVRTHHENVDGTGYPQRLAGQSLHIFTRIARICDAYDAATAHSVYKEAKSSARAMWEICCGPLRRCYDPVLSKVLMSLIQPFPIGAKLRLVDGRYAVVVRYNRKNPFQPSIIVAYDETGRRLARDLLVGPVFAGLDNDLRIASFAGEDLSYIYQYTPEDEAPPRCDAQSLFETVFP